MPLRSVVVSNKLIHFISGFWNLFLPLILRWSSSSLGPIMSFIKWRFSSSRVTPRAARLPVVILRCFWIVLALDTNSDISTFKKCPHSAKTFWQYCWKRDRRTDQLYMCKSIWAPSTLPLRYTGATPCRGRACSRSRVMSAALRLARTGFVCWRSCTRTQQVVWYGSWALSRGVKGEFK